MTDSKAKISYYRKLYLAYLIDTTKSNLVSLEEVTGMPRRTIETSMKGFDDIGIDFKFVQEVGARNRHGSFKILSWGDHKKSWVKDNLQYVIDVLQ
jgi:hypothetical protein